MARFENIYGTQMDPKLLATPTADGLMSKEDKAKLDTIAEGAGSGEYVHPPTHPATMITTDATHRFVTDTQISTWNAKASTAIATTSVNGLMSKEDKAKLDGIATGATRVTIDGTLSSTSANPVQNKVINNALAGKAPISHTHTKSQITDFPTSLPANGGNATTANTWTIARNINGMVVQGDANRVNYGVCSTAAATAGKIVNCTGYGLITGSEITVKFTVTNSAANPTLNVNNTGAKAIYYRGAAISSGYLAANHTYTFRYNGTQYELVGDIDTSKTYNPATQTANGLMSATDKKKLDGIASSANNYVHPANHPASIITQDATHRFVTDTEKSTWNAKASTAIATTSTNGLMSATDKKKLDGIATGATKIIVDSALSSSSTNPVQNKVINSALAGKAASSHTHTATQITGFTADRALISDSAGRPTVSAVTTTELGYLDGVTSSIQTQLNGKAASSHTHTKSQITDFPTSIKNPTFITVQLNSGTTEGTNKFTYDGSAAKTINITPSRIGAAASSHTHSYSQITGLTANRALVSDSSGKPAVSAVTSTELGYLDGVTSNIQTQLNNITSKLATMEAKLKTAVFIKQ